jgi:hypothetical protein
MVAIPFLEATVLLPGVDLLFDQDTLRRAQILAH